MSEANSTGPAIDETVVAAIGTLGNEARRIGDYELLEEVARGGMGIVYKARQVSLGRLVAVKLILNGLSTAQMVQRFRTEASTAASLHHPNIVAVREVGVWQGENYLAMEYVDGPNLSKVIGHQPLPARRAACYLKAIAEAVQFAHDRKILHRDLKPSNVLIDSNDQPRLTDFGVAKHLEKDVDLTLSGQILGSPNYMPPEQATPKSGSIGRHSDIYSLGAVLYHMLTGRPPFQGQTPADVLRQVIDADPIPPRRLNPSVPLDLETICVKCLEKEPAKRYASARLLAEEAARFLNDEPIVARPVTQFERLLRWRRRKPVVAALAASLIVVFVAGLTLSLSQWLLAARRGEESRERSVHSSNTKCRCRRRV